MIAKNIQSPKILFSYEKKDLITKTLLIISVIFTRMRGKRNTNWTRRDIQYLSTGRASRQNKPSAQIYNS